MENKKWFIPGSVPSSKNGRRWTGKYFIASKTVVNYRKVAKEFKWYQKASQHSYATFLRHYLMQDDKDVAKTINRATKTMADYLEDEVDEKYYINNEKAMKLIQELIEADIFNQELWIEELQGADLFIEKNISLGLVRCLKGNIKTVIPFGRVFVTRCFRNHREVTREDYASIQASS